MGCFDVEFEGLQRQLLLQGRVRLRPADVSRVDHQAQDHRLATPGVFQVSVGIPVGRRLGQPGQQRRLGQGQIARLLAKVGVGRGGDAIGQASIVDFVEIDLEDIALWIAAADLGGQHHLADLAPQRLLETLLGRQQHQAGDLLWNAAESRYDFPLLHIVKDGTGDGDGVDAAVLPEALILGGDGGIDQVGRDLFVGHQDAPPAGGVHHFVQQVAVPVIDPGADKLGRLAAQCLRRRQVSRDGRVGDHQSTGKDHEKHPNHENRDHRDRHRSRAAWRPATPWRGCGRRRNIVPVGAGRWSSLRVSLAVGLPRVGTTTLRKVHRPSGRCLAAMAARIRAQGTGSPASTRLGPGSVGSAVFFFVQSAHTSLGHLDCESTYRRCRRCQGSVRFPNRHQPQGRLLRSGPGGLVRPRLPEVDERGRRIWTVKLPGPVTQ